ncbi:hypothetical protein EG328_005273 [Venturia inaequalis]|uniref:GATA-type domain-containing protein n=1 Tax=Venturia inaequalis TaxID=5025 RepID=A0A8H3YW46_VENIN|nr:hypothetical protein EG328_005273 [Venturia inaequalis]
MGSEIHNVNVLAPTPTRLPSFNMEDRPSLPSFESISRPSSRMSTTSTRSISSGYYYPAALQQNSSVQLPALSALASVANEHRAGSPLSISRTPSMTLTPAAPSVIAGGSISPPICQNCSTSTTPLWRRDENGSVLCNACGLFLKLHGRPRPISLKTDVIKSRNRVKTTGRGGVKKGPGAENAAPTPPHQSLPAAYPSNIPVDPQRRTTSQPLSTPLIPGSERSVSPLSRTGTPGLGGQNIAPQHLFDSVVHMPNGSVDPYGNSPPHPAFNFRAHSPGAASTSSLTNGSLSASNGVAPSHHLEPPSLRREQSEVTELKTRVSELEVINDLFRGRVTELERLEKDAREEAERARLSEHTMASAFNEAKRRINELEAEVASAREEPQTKKVKVTDSPKDDIPEALREISPLSAPA